MRPDGLVEDFIRVMEDKGADANVTLRSLILGSQDSETGWYGAAYSNSTIKMIILPRGRKEYELPAGHSFWINFAGFTASQVTEGDLIVDADDRVYHVVSVTPHCVGDLTVYYECELAYFLGEGEGIIEPPFPVPMGYSGVIRLFLGDVISNLTIITVPTIHRKLMENTMTIITIPNLTII